MNFEKKPSTLQKDYHMNEQTSLYVMKIVTEYLLYTVIIFGSYPDWINFAGVKCC